MPCTFQSGIHYIPAYPASAAGLGQMACHLCARVMHMISATAARLQPQPSPASFRIARLQSGHLLPPLPQPHASAHCCSTHRDLDLRGAGPTALLIATACSVTCIHGVQALLERYFELLPQVCGCEAEALQWKRMLFAGQPCYRSAPTQPQFDRVLQVRCMEGCYVD